MLFPTAEFFVFFTVVLVVSWLTRPLGLLHRLGLVGLSWVFYAWWDLRLLPLLVVASLIAWLWGVLLGLPVMDTRTALARKRLLWVGAGLYLGLLFWFKYLLFLTTAMNNLLMALRLPWSLPVHEAVLPLGISFFTFQMLSYLFDVYYGRTPPRRNPVDVLLYLAFFPQLIAGPIVRPGEFFPQLDRLTRPEEVPVGKALVLIARGLWKKVLVAHYLAVLVVDPAFVSPHALLGWEVALALFAFGAQIYADFSAYTDMALGCALLLGYRLPENFDRPYASASLGEFWRRWHITLGAWLRDYVYVPLGGSRQGRGRTARNLLITFLLGGLWHGAGWTYLIWGVMHGLAMTVERAVTSALPAGIRGVLRPLGWAWALLVVTLAWAFFRAPDLETALAVLQRLGSVEGGGVLHPLAPGLTGAVYLAQLLPFSRTFVGRLDLEGIGTGLGLLILLLSLAALSVLRPAGVAPFLYFQF